MWIRADIQFDEPIATLTISIRKLPNMASMIASIASDSPEAIAPFIYDLIKHHRPELAGGILYGMHLDLYSQEWQFLYGHRSLPRRKQGERPAPIALIPPERAQKELDL
jgi:hypothetical protein